MFAFLVPQFLKFSDARGAVLIFCFVVFVDIFLGNVRELTVNYKLFIYLLFIIVNSKFGFRLVAVF